MATAITNIGELFTGDLAAPTAEAEGILVEDGIITAIGNGVSSESAETVIDVRGATIGPGLIDSHCHVVLGDYTPRQSTVGFLSSYVHGGISQVVSPGEIHTPGRPHDAAGVKALAILAQRSWSTYRPNGMKVNGGSIVLEPVLTRQDLEEVANEGVKLAKFGFGLYEDPMDGIEQVRSAQSVGIRVMCHSGGASIPGSKPITAEHLIALEPDVCGHINGGPTSLNDDGVLNIIRETTMTLQLVQAGCLRSALEIVETILEEGREQRVIIGSDTPTGTGVMPLGMLKTVAELTSLGGVDPATCWAWASGNIADVYDLSGGKIEVGRPADICVFDAPWGSQADSARGALERGDIPGISAVMIDGSIRALKSRNTPAASRQVGVTPSVGELPGSSHV